MGTEIESIGKIYRQLQDKVSKDIFISRLNYSFTGDCAFIDSMIEKTVRNRKEWIDFCSLLRKKAETNQMVIFGAGIWGKILYAETNAFISWENVIDTAPEGKKVGELAAVSLEKFVENYQGEQIVISSYKNSQSMIKQLMLYDIPKENIVNGGVTIYRLTEGAIYFDLEALLPVLDEEVLVDGGCFDGANSKQFLEWTEGKGYSYCFEPDEKNILAIQKKLEPFRGKFEIIPNALWSERQQMSLNAKGNFASSLLTEEEGSDKLSKAITIETASVDECLGDKRITFIKMDIEGAELQALKGCRKVIKSQKPRLAISVYHRLEDIWKIPELILSYYPEYKFYLRHYSFADYDTVLYAIP